MFVTRDLKSLIREVITVYRGPDEEYEEEYSLDTHTDPYYGEPERVEPDGG